MMCQNLIGETERVKQTKINMTITLNVVIVNNTCNFDFKFIKNGTYLLFVLVGAFYPFIIKYIISITHSL